jgi:hypothetical protein
MSEIALPSVFQIAVSLYAYFLPLMLYAAWSTLAFWDLSRRSELSPSATFGWTAIILLLPFVGAAAYHVAGGSGIPKPLRATVVGGGIVLFGAALLIGQLLGSAA